NQIAATGNLFTNNANLGVGYRSNNSEHLRGYFDEVRIWNVARTQAQIAANMYGPLPSPQAGLLAYYTFDGSNPLANSASTQFNGTLQNPAVVVNNTQCLSYTPFEAVASNNGPACLGGSVVLTADEVPGATYRWTGPGGFVSTDRVAVRNNLGPADFGTYRLVVSSACCTDTAFTSFGLTPAVSAAAYPSAIQIGDSAVLVGFGAQNYVWQPGNLSGESVVVRPTRTTTYTVTGALDSAGCVNTAQVTVLVNCPAITVLPADVVSLCQGQSVVLSVEEANGSEVYLAYEWSPATGLSSANQAAVIAAPQQTTAYTVTAYGIEGCVATTIVVVQIGDGSFALVPDQTTICVGNAVTLTGFGQNLQWFVNGNPIEAPPGNVLVDYPPVGTRFYTLRGSDASGCSGETTVQVAVDPYVEIDIEIAADDSILCFGESTTLTALGSAENYFWQPGNLVGPSISISPDQTTTHTLIAYNSSRCADTAQVTIFVGPLGSDLDDVTLCAGQSVRLAATELPGATYLWAPAEGLSATDRPVVWANPAVTTEYTVTGTTADGCVDRQTVVVTVVPSPSVSASSPSPTICPGNPALLVASNPGALPLKWLPGGQTTSEIIVYPTVTTTYSAVVYAQNGCTDTATVVVSVFEPPSISVEALPPSVCAGVSSSITATGALQYNVQPGNGFFLQGQSFSVSPTTTTTYTVIGANAPGCLDTAYVTVFIDSITYLTPQTQTVCRGDTAVLSLSGYENYEWRPGLLTGSTVRVSPPITTVYTVYASNPSGCADTVSFTVNVLPRPQPVVTPESDTVCFRYVTYLVASGGDAYVWFPGPYAGETLFVALDSTTTFTLVARNDNGCVAEAARRIEVVPLPVVEAVAEADSVCPGAPVRLFASGAQEYVWVNELTGEAYFGDAIEIFPDETTTLILTGTDRFGCQASDTVVVYTYDPPAFEVEILPGDTVCIGSEVRLTVPEGYTYFWFSSLAFSDSSDTSVAFTADEPGVVSVVVAALDSRGCVSADTAIVTVVNLPDLTAAGDTVCPGGTARLTASLVADGGSTVGEFAWFELDSLNRFTGEIYFGSPAEVVVARPTRFVVVATDVYGCESSDTVEVAVRTPPTAGVTQAGPYVCQGEAMALIVSGGVDYRILPEEFFIFADYEQGVAFVRPDVTTTFTVTAFDEFGCADSDTTTVVVRPNPVIGDFSYEPAICFGDSTVLFYSGSTDIIIWKLEFVDTSLELTGGAVVLAPRTTTTYTLRA
ncbi:MAG: LamG domain-containing protein, partial [Bacteroidia bacterium]|nr:LamG domain-containing protein [Bacteroidia bacterium]